ncbi:MAG: DUF1569 domain-containing protein [Bacteroidia bacterium]
MESLFDAQKRGELLARINQLTPEHKAAWGKMNGPQMLAHCAMAFDTAFGTISGKQIFLGKLFGKMAKKKLTAPEPFGKNSPTSPKLIAVDANDFEKEKQRLIQQVTKFGEGGPALVTDNLHMFYGKMTKQEWDLLMYKHTEHHLRQFGV